MDRQFRTIVAGRGSVADQLLIHNGIVRTLDPAGPEARWVLVEDGVIRRAGNGEPLVTDGVRRFDLQGRVLVPGFCDAHVHLTWIATALLGPDVSGSESVDDLLSKLAAWQGGGRGPADAWIVGDGFDESTWGEKRLPRRSDIDRVEKSRPVLVKRVCGHVGVLNSAALAAVEAGPHTDQASGRIAESDLWALNDRLRPDAQRLAQVLPQVFARLHEHGVTAVHDVTSPEMLRALQIANAKNPLPLRVSCALPVTHLEALKSCGVAAGMGDSRLRLLGVKIFVDGSLGAHTAYLREPYADEPTTSGTPLHAPEELDAFARAANEAGLQLMIHAIGDAALERVLDAVRPHVEPGNGARHRLEHVELTPPDLVARLAESGLYACVQPNFAGRWSQPGGMNEQRLGARLEHCNVYRTLLDAGIPLAFGSDCMPLGPLYGLQSAVRHPIAEQSIEPTTALALYTQKAAALVQGESRFGAIRSGMNADLAVLSSDPTDAEALARAQVAATFVAGRLLYEHSRIDGAR
jgi:predicted amidohydrolase YtcJ